VAKAKRDFDEFAESLSSCPTQSDINKNFTSRYSALKQHMINQKKILDDSIEEYKKIGAQTNASLYSYWNALSAASKLLHHMDLAAITLDTVIIWNDSHDKKNQCTLKKDTRAKIVAAVTYWEKSAKKYWQFASCYADLYHDMSMTNMGAFQVNGVESIGITSAETYNENSGEGNRRGIATIKNLSNKKGSDGTQSAVQLSNFQSKNTSTGSKVSGSNNKFSMKADDYQVYMNEYKQPDMEDDERSIWEQLSYAYAKKYKRFYPPSI